MLSESESHASAGDNAAPVPSPGTADGDVGGAERRDTAPSDDASSREGATAYVRGRDDHLLCAAAVLMSGEGNADFDLRQKSVELVTAIVAKQQNQQPRYAAPLCLSSARAQLAAWLKSQMVRDLPTRSLLLLTLLYVQAAAGDPVDDVAQQLEPLADALRALELRLREGNSSSDKSKKKKKAKKKRALTGAQTGAEDAQANRSAPIMYLA